MRVYVAGKWEERLRAREVMETIRAKGHVITHDWTHEPKEETDEVLLECANLDVQGVESADALVFVAEKNLKFAGAYTELGIAIAHDLPVYVLGEFATSNIFMRLPSIKRVTEAQLYGYLNGKLH